MTLLLYSDASKAMVMDRGTNFTLIQELRGFASIWVVLFHASEGGHITALKSALPAVIDSIVFDSGHYGVAIFFALSGFVIAHSLRHYEASWRFVGLFALRRSIRLDPPYWLSIVVALFFAGVSARVKGGAYELPNFGTLAAHLTYLQVLLGKPEINPVYWTLTYEIQFYIFLVVMLVLFSRRSGAVALAWLIMGLLAFGSAWGFFQDAPAGLFIDLWASFFVGVLGYRARGLGVPILIALVGTMWFSPGADAFSRFSSGTAVLLAFSFRTGLIGRGLGWSWLGFLGTISYSLYLLHNPLTGATGFLIRRTFGDGLAASVLSLIAILVVTVSASAVFWLIVERPAHKMARMLGERWPKADTSSPDAAIGTSGPRATS